jgi:hypothetical protein
MNCTPVKRHEIRDRLHEEQAEGPGFTGFDACIFLLIQAEYRGFTGMGGVAALGALRPASRTLPCFYVSF